MAVRLTKKQLEAWRSVAPLLEVKDPASHLRACQLLDRLVDEIGEDERHQLAGFTAVLGTIIDHWEDQNGVRVAGSAKTSKVNRVMPFKPMKSKKPLMMSEILAAIENGRRI